MSGSKSFQDAQETIKANRSAAPEVVEEMDEIEEPVELETSDIEVSDEAEVIETDESPAIDAPNSWSKEDKEHFSTLPFDTQERLAKQARNRDLNIRQTQDQNATKSKELDTELAVVRKQKADYFAQLKASSKEPSSDMLDPESELYDPDAYHLANAKHKKHQTEVQKIDEEIKLENATELKTWQAKEVEVYREVLPDFVDPDKGQDFRNNLAEYAVKAMGISMDDAANIFPTTPAKEMVILDKARRWDAAVKKQQAAKSNPKPKTLQGGNSNPTKPKVTNKKSAAANWSKHRSPTAAGELLKLSRG